MMLRDRCKFLCTASVMILLLGLIRGIGGVIDLINSTDTLIEIDTSSTTLVLLIIFLIILSAAAFITAISVYEQNKNSVLFGIILSVIFVLNSITNGYILFGNTINDTVIINTIASIIIISLLILGRRTLNKIEEDKTTVINKSQPKLIHGSLSS